MKNQFWKWMLVITIVSLVSTFILGSEIPWNNLDNACFSWPHAKSILYDISVGIFTSMILVWCIDRIQLRDAEKQEEKQRLIVYKKLAPILTEYYNFYLFLYIATRNTPVPANSKVLTSLYLCKEELLQQITSENPFYKDGYYGDPAKNKKKMDLMRQHSNNPNAMKYIMNMSTSLPWYTCWEIEGEKFYDNLSQIEKDFPTFFTNEMLEMFDEILGIVMPQKNLVNFVEGKFLPDWAADQVKISQIPTQMFIDAYKIEEILRLLDGIMQYIESDSSIILRKRDLAFFNDRNVCPTLGYSCEPQPTNSAEADKTQ